MNRHPLDKYEALAVLGYVALIAIVLGTAALVVQRVKERQQSTQR